MDSYLCGNGSCFGDINCNNSYFVDERITNVAYQLAKLLLSQNNLGPNYVSGDIPFLKDRPLLKTYKEECFLRDQILFCHSSPTNSCNDVNFISGFNTPENSLSDFEKEDSLADAFRPRSPPLDYVCHLCYQSGHFIQYCPMSVRPKGSEKTPYQGPLQSEGEFSCYKCKRRWVSQKSFANVGQKCRKCHVTVFPKKQRKRKDSLASSFNSSEPTPSVSPSLAISESDAPEYCYGSVVRNIRF